MQIDPNFIGLAAGILTATSMLPQLIKLLREKQAEDISVFMLCVLLAGLALWVAYGFMKNDLPLILTNCCALLINTLVLIFTLKYKD